MPKQRTFRDFGFDPEESPYHFEVEMGDEVRIVEHRLWETDETVPVDREPTQVKAVLDRYRWSRIEGTVAEVFNRRLREAGQRPARWKEGSTLLASYFGKELTLLMWAVEGADPTLIPNMVANWVGLVPEERWWLYTTINATFNTPEHGRDRGWRKAVKIAFAENPAPAPPPSMRRDAPKLPIKDEPIHRAPPPAARGVEAEDRVGDGSPPPASDEGLPLLLPEEQPEPQNPSVPQPSAPARKRSPRRQPQGTQITLPMEVGDP